MLSSGTDGVGVSEGVTGGGVGVAVGVGAGVAVGVGVGVTAGVGAGVTAGVGVGVVAGVGIGVADGVADGVAVGLLFSVEGALQALSRIRIANRSAANFLFTGPSPMYIV